MKTLLHGLRRLVVWLLLLPIYFYKGAISPLTPPSRRFTPSCSTYAIEAIRRHGPLRGSTWPYVVYSAVIHGVGVATTPSPEQPHLREI